MKHNSKKMVYGALVGAMYVVLTLLAASFGMANGLIQVRVSEALTILPLFTPSAIWGLFAGCIISNILTGCALWDIVFGSLATLIGAVITYYIGKVKLKNSYLIAPLGPILSNTAIIPVILTYVYGLTEAYYIICLGIFAGELISAGLLGILLYLGLKKHQNVIFGKET